MQQEKIRLKLSVLVAMDWASSTRLINEIHWIMLRMCNFSFEKAYVLYFYFTCEILALPWFQISDLVLLNRLYMEYILYCYYN